MLHAKFQDHRTCGSGEDDFKGFTTYWQCGHLGLVTKTIYINFRSLFSRRIHMNICFDWPSGFREALRCLNTVDDGQTTDDVICKSMGKL